VQRWQNMCLAPAWARWAEQWREEERLRITAERVVLRLSHSFLLSAWNQWQGNQASSAELRRRAEKGVLRWMRGSLSSAWLAWLHQHAESTRLGLIGARILLKWARQELSQPWCAWRHHVAEKKRLQRTASMVLQRWANARLYPAFHSWQGEYRAVKRRAVIADKVVKRWLSMSCASALNRWVEQADQKRALLELTHKVLNRWTHKGLAEAWNTWCAEVSESQRLSRALNRTACRWMRLDLSKTWTTWAAYCEGQLAADALEEEIRKTFARIERAFATSFAKCVLEQWHAVTSSKLAAQYRLQGVSFLAWHAIAAESASFVRSSNIIRANGLTRRKGGAYTAMLWECMQFKASHRTRVTIAFQRLRQRRLAGWCVLHWFYTVKAACEEEAHMKEELQIFKAKSLAHFLSEWRIVAVRQKDLRESASTIAQQWEREITLKKKLGCQPPTPESPESKSKPGGGTVAQSPTSSQVQQGQSMVKTMWSDMQVLSTGQQYPADIGPFIRGLNDPQVYSHGLTQPHSSLAQIGRIPAARTAPLDLVEAFRRWRATLANKARTHPVLNLSDLAPASEPTAYDKAQSSPRTLKLKSPRGQSDAARRLSPRELTHAGSPGAGRSKSPVPRLALDKLAPQPVPQVPGNAATSPKRSPKKLLKSPRQEAAARPAAVAPAPTSKETPRQGFFPDNVFSSWMGGESARSANSRATSSDAASKAAVSGSQATSQAAKPAGWLSGLGFATPKSEEQAGGRASAAAAQKPGPAPAAASSLAVASAPKMKRELVPSPRRVQLTPAQIEQAEAEIRQAAAAAVAAAAEVTKPVCVHTFSLHPCIHTYKRTHIHTYTHTHIRTYTHTHIHAYTHTRELLR